MRTTTFHRMWPTLIAWAAAAPAVSHAQVLPATQAQPHVAGRVLAVSRAGFDDRDAEQVFTREGGRGHRLGRSGLFMVDVPPGREAAVIEKLKRHPSFKQVELDRAVPPSLAVTDPYVGSEWHLSKIGAPAAWDVAQGSNVTIAILDSGVDGTHPDLSPRLLPGWNFYSNNADTSDVMGHGTGVAGTAAAATNNGVGVAAVAGQAKLLPVRVSDATGYAMFSTIAQGLIWAADQGAKVANISYGVTGSSTVIEAANYMRSKGGLVFAAAGNSGTELTTADTPAMLTVSATDSNDVRASWSSYGGFVTLAAPGQGIYTTLRGGGYGAVNGTSYATPTAAGVAALVFSANPALTNAQVEGLLKSTAVDLGTAGRDTSYGHGRVNAAAAVQAALALKPISTTVSAGDTRAPTSAITAPAAGATVSGLVNVDVAAADDVGVARVVLRVNGAVVATDTAAPFAFSWNSATVPNGAATLTAIAYDAAGNAATSAAVGVTVSNALAAPVADTTAPSVAFASPSSGGKVRGNVTVSTSASDDSGTAGIIQTLYIDNVKVATATGAKLSYSWNTSGAAKGLHTLQVLAKDAAGNTGSRALRVSK